jgi:PIN domain nuclease of toxin-antitoxin system
MKILLDTCVLLWAVEEPSYLSESAIIAIKRPENVRLLSAATIWELAIKVGQKKLLLSMPYLKWMNTVIADVKLSILPITVEYADQHAILPPHHKDPFDRLIIAQALVEQIHIVSADTMFDLYGVKRIW